MNVPDRLQRNIEKYEIYELFYSIAEKNGLKNLDNANIDIIFEIIKKSLCSIKSPTLLYGKQTERMFANIVSCLPNCLLVKQEDKGELLSKNKNVKIPDYKIITTNDKIFVEVKNYYSTNSNKPFKIKNDELSKLIEYSNLMGEKLYIAVYWSCQNIWTLLLPNDFIKNKKFSMISFAEAYRLNKMSLLGDYIIGTTPPLEMKIFIEESVSKHNSFNTLAGTIVAVELFCNKVLIKDKYEEKILFNLILFNNWNESMSIKFCEKKKMRYIHFEYNPIKRIEGQNFNMINYLSSIMSMKYKFILNNQDCSGLVIEQISLKNLLLEIDTNKYKSKTLPLWFFFTTP